MLHYTGLYGEGTGVIWYDEMLCQGNEKSMADCQRGASLGVSDCSHVEDVGLTCFTDALTTPQPLVGECQLFEFARTAE